MNTIKDIFENLNDEDRRQLLYGFEHEFAQFVCLPDNQFIGVNIDNIKHLKVEQKAGVWATGTVKGSVPICNT
jgi:hypothetical protein